MKWINNVFFVHLVSLVTYFFFSSLTFANPVSYKALSNSSSPGFLLSWLGVTERPWWYNPILTVTGGLASARVTQTQSLTTSSDLTVYNYQANRSRSTEPLFGILLGTEFPVYPDWRLALGLAYYQPTPFSSGSAVLVQGIDAPSSDRFTYRYKVLTSQFLVEGKLLWSWREHWYPYLSAGAGIGLNKAYGYTNNVSPFQTFTPEFTSRTSPVFTYNLGAGIDVDGRKNWRLGAGYRFVDFGKAALGSGNVDVTPFKPVISKPTLYAHEVVAQFTYLMS